MSSVTDLQTVIANNVHCAVCLDLYRNPQVLRCLHSYCETCVTALMVNDSVECPVCRNVTSSSDIKSDFKTREQVEIYSGLKNTDKTRKRKAQDDDQSYRKCDLCEDKEVEFFCKNCSRYICQTCCKVHAKCSACKSEDAIQVKQRLADVKESLSNFGKQLEAKSEKFMKEKGEYIKCVNEKAKACLYDLDTSEAKMIQDTRSFYNYLRDSVVVSKNEAVKAVEEQASSFQGIVQKHVTDVAQIQPHVLMATHGALQQKMQQSLEKIQNAGFVQFDMVLKKGTPSGIIQAAPVVHFYCQEDGGSDIPINGSGTFGSQFEHLSLMNKIGRNGILTRLSVPYEIGDFYWRAEMQAEWQNNVKYAGFYVKCFRDVGNAKWQCRAQVKIHLLPQTNNGTTLSQGYIKTFASEAENIWGLPYFIEWEKLMDSSNGYILNDAVKVNVEVQITGPPKSYFLKGC